MPREGHDNNQMLKAKNIANFNPRAPRGARRNIFLPICNMSQFQSTCPARGTTTTKCSRQRISLISIHVPREGHDVIYFCRFVICHNFNPRAPRGARLLPLKMFRRRSQRFQSTCPARGTTTLWHSRLIRYRPFQSTCPARGTTHRHLVLHGKDCHFNPRAPRGARQIIKNNLTERV